METITFTTITDVSEAEKMWKAISAEDHFANTWLFRYLYYKYFSFPLSFLVAWDAHKPVGLLPLQYNTDNNYLEFFGGGYFEDNAILTLPGYEYVKPLLLSEINSPLLLEWMEEEIPGFSSTVEDMTYSLNLENLTSVEEYLEQYWQGKTKRNLKAQIRKLQEANIQITYDDFEDVDEMMDKNIKRFGNESTFLKPHRREFIHDLIATGFAHTITISINGKHESIGFAVIYKNECIGLNSGTNPEFNGLGKMLILEKLKQAITHGAQIYEARAGDLGWKEAFHLTPRPQYHLDLRSR